MSWRLTTTAAIVLVLASTLTNGVQAGTLQQDTPEWERYWSQLRRVYNRVKTADIAYEPSGTRSRFRRRNRPSVRHTGPRPGRGHRLHHIRQRSLDHQLCADDEMGQNAAK